MAAKTLKPLLQARHFNPWGKHREMRAVPRQTFRQWYLENRRKQ